MKRHSTRTRPLFQGTNLQFFRKPNLQTITMSGMTIKSAANQTTSHRLELAPSMKRYSTKSTSCAPNQPLNHGTVTPEEDPSVDVTEAFLNIRRSLMSSLHIDPEVSKERFEANNTTLEQEKTNSQPSFLSKATLSRAHKVKMTFSLYYLAIQHYQESGKDQNGSVRIPGLEGVFNPLQVIRNRKVRRRHRETPGGVLSYKTIMPPCIAFSDDPKRKLVWLVDLEEYSYDLSWRKKRFNELKRPNGGLWVPDDTRPRSFRTLRPNSRIYDKIFSSPSDSESDEKSESSRVSQSLLSDTSSQTKSKSPSALQKHSRSASAVTVGSEKSYAGSIPDFVITTPDEEQIPAMRNVSIEPLRPTHTTKGSVAHISRRSSIESQIPSDEMIELSDHFNTLKRLESLVVVGNYCISQEPHILNSRFEKEESRLSDKTTACNENFKRLESTVVSQYQTFFDKTFSTLNDYKYFLENNHSNKVDSLLSLSDRTIGEINTTMALEIRNLTERVEKLDNNMCIPTNDMMTLVGYRLLENLIMLVLRLVWIAVSIWRIFKGVFRVFFWFLL